MNKTLLRLLVYELLERTARYRALLNEISISPMLLATIHSTLHDISTNLVLSPADLKNLGTALPAPSLGQLLYADQPIADADCVALLKQFVFAPYKALSELTQLLSVLMPGSVRSETYFFLSDLYLPQDPTLKPSSLPMELICAPENTVALSSPSRWGYTPLSILQKNTPMGWVSLASSWSNALILDHTRYPASNNGSGQRAAAKSVIDTLKTHLPAGTPAPTLEQIACATLALRRVGPGYYFQVVLDALLQKDLTVLYWVEPVMFMAMNHASLTDKALVILHEVAETARHLYGQLEVDGNATAFNSTERGAHSGWIQNGWLENWLAELEALVPTKATFNEKHLIRALEIQERLSDGILLSSLSRYPLNEMLPEILQALPTELTFGLQQSAHSQHHSSFPEQLTLGSEEGEALAPKGIYDVLEKVTEYPNAPREIINAGWLYKMHHSSLTLYQALNAPELASGTVEETLETHFNRPVLHTDQLLLKSIETAEIHRGLLQQQPLVTVG